MLYYGARYYDPALGRFISADTVVPEPGNPQALNRLSEGRTQLPPRPGGMFGGTIGRTVSNVEIGLGYKRPRLGDAVADIATDPMVLYSVGMFAGKLTKDAAGAAWDVGKAASLRQDYESKVRALAGKAEEMRSAGYSSEEIARALHAERRALGVEYKDMLPPDKLQLVYERNTTRYGDPLGPSIQWLLDHGKSWEDIIESAARPGGQDIVPQLLR